MIGRRPGAPCKRFQTESAGALSEFCGSCALSLPELRRSVEVFCKVSRSGLSARGCADSCDDGYDNHNG